MDNYYKKSWGFEIWMVNNNKYCGKILYIRQGQWCSFHYHKIKDETFYVRKGEIVLEYSELNNIKRNMIQLRERDSFRIEPVMVHRFIGTGSENEVIEISTQHFEEDSYRLEPSFPKLNEPIKHF
jgi:mannose-6-phosphate isomerase-like protein (cupin superfamily)